MDFLTHLKNNLNPQQYQAATYTDTSSLILAWAGSWKTRTLTYKIAYLLWHQRVNPSNILAVTFTNKAANEMKERLNQIYHQVTSQDFENTQKDFDQLISGSSNSMPHIRLADLRVWTFHSIFVKILKEDIHHLEMGYNRFFGIYDSSDSLSLLKSIIKQDSQFADIDLQIAKSKISNWKNMGLLPKDILEQVEEIDIPIAILYQKYQQQLIQANSLDFDDLLLLPYHLFQKYPQVLNKWQQKFKYILVDEAQDTNWIQFELLKQLSILPDGQTNNITFIGDDFQSIYGWRWAMMENFLNVQKRRKDIKIFRLELNYRSRPHIVEAGNNIIKNNIQQYPKTIQATRDGNDTIKILISADEIDEAANVIELIKKLKEEKDFSFNDFAILYRTNAQSQPFEEALITEGIPYKVWWGFKFFERKEIKDIVSYLKVLYNPADSISLKRIINTPSRKIGNVTIQKLEDYAIQNNLSLADVIFQIETLPIDLGTSTKNSIKQFALTLKLLQNDIQNKTPAQLVKEIISFTKYKERLIKQEGEEKAQEKMENIGQLINMAAKFTNPGKEELKMFLDEIALMSESDQQESWESVKLMTIHAAKGLEFPVVFVVGLEENIFPLARAKFEPKEMEEERRLMYVAITRAKDILFLSLAKSRTQWWQTRYNKQSRFIEEIPSHLTKVYDISSSRVQKQQDLGVGTKIRHKIFGEGEIVETWGNIWIVRFFNPKYGIKKIDLNFLQKL